jgi:hypothetical protein
MQAMRTPRGLIIDQEGRELDRPTLSWTKASWTKASWSNASARAKAAFGDGTFHGFGPTAAPLTREQRIARLEALATLLDVAFIMPGTSIRYGVDGIIRLIPVVGDLIATALALWIVREARALGAPWHVTARMLGNVAVDGVVGMVPLAGDAFDVLFRANIRNMRILRRWLARQR